MRQRPWKPRRRLARLLRRSSLLWWSVAIGLAALTGSTVQSNLATASRAADDWGSLRRVWVVERAVAAGTVIERGDVRLVDRPKGIIPTGALHTTSPVGKATRAALVRGEVVVASRLAPTGATGVAAMVAA